MGKYSNSHFLSNSYGYVFLKLFKQNQHLPKFSEPMQLSGHPMVVSLSLYTTNLSK